MFLQNIKWVVGAAFCVALVGCGTGSGFAPVKGKVTYKGQPVAGATVTFLPKEGSPAIGVTDNAGVYTMNTSGTPGVKPGEHRVGISKVASSGDTSQLKPEDMMKMMKGGQKAPTPKSEIPTKYSAPQTSDLIRTVTPDGAKNVFDFDLTD